MGWNRDFLFNDDDDDHSKDKYCDHNKDNHDKEDHKEANHNKDDNKIMFNLWWIFSLILLCYYPLALRR